MVLVCAVFPVHIDTMKDQDTETNTTILTHISDFHLPIMDHIPTYKLLSKRMLGWANLRFNRGKTHKESPFLALLKNLKEKDFALCVATGDFVNLALRNEFAHVANIFTNHGFSPENLFCVPGNHDRYTPGAQYRKDFEKELGKWIPFENHLQKYPTLKIVGNAAVIGLDTATWRGPLRAAGRIGQGQRKRLEKILFGLDPQLTPVVAMHHPPFSLNGHQFKHYLDGLQNFGPILDILQGRNAVVLHGHIHVLSYRLEGDTKVIGVPSVSNDANTGSKQLAYNTLEIGTCGLEKVTCTRLWPHKETFETFTLNENFIPI